MTTRRMGDQRGVSLIELIVVLAIMGVVSTFGLLGLSLLTGQNIKSCYRQLDHYLDATKLTAMSKQEATLKLYKGTDDGIYIHLSATNEDIRIGKAGLTVRFGDGNNLYEADGTQTLKLCFDRSTGAFKEALLADDTPFSCRTIVLSDGQRTYTMRLIPKTGKFYRE